MAINRHLSRILALQALYQHEFMEIDKEKLQNFDWEDSEKANPETKEFGYELLQGVLKHRHQLMEEILKNAGNRTEEDFVLMDKIILLLSTYSLLYQKDIPANVIINEAIILAKDFSQMASYKFINGILDAIRKKTK